MGGTWHEGHMAWAGGGVCGTARASAWNQRSSHPISSTACVCGVYETLGATGSSGCASTPSAVPCDVPAAALAFAWSCALAAAATSRSRARALARLRTLTAAGRGHVFMPLASQSAKTNSSSWRWHADTRVESAVSTQPRAWAVRVGTLSVSAGMRLLAGATHALGGAEKVDTPEHRAHRALEGRVPLEMPSPQRFAVLASSAANGHVRLRVGVEPQKLSEAAVATPPGADVVPPRDKKRPRVAHEHRHHDTARQCVCHWT